MLGARPSTVQVRFAPMVVPVTGVAHVPRLTLGAEDVDGVQVLVDAMHEPTMFRVARALEVAA